MSELTPTQKATALDRLASSREGFTGLGEGYSFGVVSRPENPKDLTPEQRKEQTVWGITSWDETKLGPKPTTEEIEAEASNPPLPLITAEDWIAQQGYLPMRVIGLMDFERKLAESGKTSAKLTAVRQWIDGIMGQFAADPSPRNDWPDAPHGFEETVQDAGIALMTP